VGRRAKLSTQCEVIDYLIAAGADPNAVDKNGVTALHRSVRSRCSAAVDASSTGKSDSGSQASKDEQGPDHRRIAPTRRNPD
jgi:ankyrin repeat protein